MANLVNTVEVNSCAVKDKIDALLKCVHVEKTTTNKADRWGAKYLATNAFHPEILELLKNDVAFKATAKVDGTCVLIQDGKINKRRDVGDNGKIPPTWFKTGTSERKGHLLGFLPTILTCPDDKWFVDCHPKTDGVNYNTSKVMVLVLNSDTRSSLEYKEIDITELEGHTVELMGPKIQKNPHKLKMHCVMKHGLITLKKFPDLKKYLDSSSPTGTTSSLMEDLKMWFTNDEQGKYFEGVVLHFTNGKMFKLHRNHLDLIWDANSTLALDQIKL